MGDGLNIPIARTNLMKSDIECVKDVLESGWLVQGKKVKEFEKKWSEFTGAKHSIAVTSCTSAMHLSLLALNIKEGDEVIVPAFTWVSTANVVEHIRGRVVFCDIDLDTFNLDMRVLSTLINSNTKAILPVHLFGLAAKINEIMELADSNGIAVIEDAACGFGTKYFERHVGTFGHTGCFSFHPRKAVTTGEGGMITTNKDDIAEKIRRLRDHGANMSDLQRHLGSKPYILADHSDAGYNQRMTDIQASLGSAQMDRATEILAERKKIAKKYDSVIGNLEWLKTPPTLEGYTHSYQSYPCLFSPKKINLSNIAEISSRRNRLMEFLGSNGISTRPATHAVHMLEFYKKKYGISPGDFPNAFIANECSISFPLFNGMSEDEINFVVEKIGDFSP